MGDGQSAMTITIPPVELDYIIESEVGNQIEDVVRYHDRRRRSAAISSVLDDRAQRWPVQVVEVGMGNQYQIDGWKVAQTDTGLAQTFEHEQPACKIGIDDHVLTTDLHEKAGVSDEGHAQFAVCYELWLMGFASSGSDRRMAYQTPKLARSLAQRGIFNRRF